jgi:uncharacterized protein
LALTTLLDLGVAPGAPVVTRGLEWLLTHQQDDGSWTAPPILRVPPPDQPWQSGATVSGIIVPDQRRSFVTATVVSVLGRLQQSAEKTRHRKSMPERRLHDANLDDEVRLVVDAFESFLGELPENLRRLTRATPLWARRGAGLSHYLPFWLNTTLAGGRLQSEAHQMALANRFGQFFCLLQDGVIDQDTESSPAILLPLNALFLQFVHGYQYLFPANHPFWSYFERYWQEYLEALAREKLRHGRPLRYEPDDFLWLGRKFSPVKICAAGMALLANRLDSLPAIEQIVEQLQTGYQMLDDLRDWREDLARDHWTWPLTLAHGRSAGWLSPADAERLLWRERVAVPVLEAAIQYFERADQLAIDYSLRTLHQWIEQLIQDARTAIRDAHTQANSDSKVLLPLQIFSNGSSIVFNVATGAVYDVEPEVAALAEQLASGVWQPNNGEEQAIVRELAEAGVLTTLAPPAKPTDLSLRTLFLNATPAYGHRCATCFGRSNAQRWQAAPLAGEIGEQAIDAFLLRSGAASLARLVFLNPGPSLDWDVIAQLAAYGRMRASALRKIIRCYVVVDPAAADVQNLAAFVNDGGCVHVHRDGIRCDADMERLIDSLTYLDQPIIRQSSICIGLENYTGAVVDVAARLHECGFKLIGVQSRQVRPIPPKRWSPAAISAMQADYAALAEYFARTLERGQLVPIVDVLRPLLQVYGRERRASHCGAGTTVLAVAAQGEFLPCYRFVDEPALALGHVQSGLERQAIALYQQITVDGRQPCGTCWARYLCGGGCFDNHVRVNGDIRQPDLDECALITHRYAEAIKLAVRLQAYLPGLAAQVDREDFVTFVPS